jgi:lambda family phage portal protein
VAETMNFIDKAICYVAPVWGFKRQAYRQALEEQRRNYDAARRDRLGAGWNPTTSPFPEDIDRPSRQSMRARARDLERNSDMCRGVIGAIERNVIGSGISPQPMIQTPRGRDMWKWNDRIKELWKEWTRAEHCDVSGTLTFYELERMCVTRRVVDGEVLVALSLDPSARFPLKIQLVETDLLAEEVLNHNGNNVYGGVEVNSFMRPLAYHVRPDPAKPDKIRVDAGRMRLLFYKSRPLQVRGVTEFASVMERVRDISEYISAELTAARVAACLAGFVVTEVPKSVSIGRPGASVEKKDGSPVAVESIESGTMNYLQPGEDVRFTQPGRPNLNAGAFVNLIQRLIGVGLGMSYELIGRDLSQTNYSSARQGHLEDRRTFRAWQEYVVANVCQPVYEAFVDSCVLAGLLPIPNYQQRREAYLKCRWITPGWPWIDPLKEASAAEKQIGFGLATYAEVCGSQGKEWEEVFEQRKREQEYADELGLRLGVRDETPPAKDEAEEGGAHKGEQKEKDALDDADETDEDGGGS